MPGLAAARADGQLGVLLPVARCHQAERLLVLARAKVLEMPTNNGCRPDRLRRAR